MLWLILTISQSLAGECVGPATTPQEVKTHVDDAMLAFATLDEEGVVAAFTLAEKALPCMTTLMAPTDAASYHRLVGVKAFLDGDDAEALLAFQAAHSVQPDYVLSAKIAPEGGKLRRLFDEAASRPTPPRSAYAAPSGQTGYVDGTRSSERPDTVPAILQFADSAGAAKWSGYVLAGESLPTDKRKPEPAPVKPAPAPEPIAAAPKPTSDDGFPPSDDGFPAADDGFPPLADLDDAPVPKPEPRTAPKPAPAPRPEPAASPKPIDTSRPLDRPSAGKSPKGTLTALAITTGVLTAGAIGTTFGARAAFDDNPSAGLFYTTNGAYFGSIGLGALTAGFTIGALASPGGK